MKKFIIFLFAGVFTLSAFSQNWVALTQREPSDPEITLNRSNNSEVNFTVGVPGFFSTPITENGTNYQRIFIQGHGAASTIGEPEIPVITHRIAVPDCLGGITYSVRITDSQTLPGYMLYPVPDYQLNSEGMWEEVFTVNPLAYLPNAFTPGSDYAVAETGAFRNQKFVTLNIHPFQFNPATGDLQVATEMEVTLTFHQPLTDVNAQLGPFSKSAAATFLNYEGSGNGFMQYDKAFEKPGFVPGKVKWITITHPAQADTLSCDYLIVTVPEFFNSQNADLQRLAEHRAWYNGYDVAIVNVAHIFSDSVGFYYEGPQYSYIPFDKYKDEQRIRTFIRRVYEGQNAPHIGDGHLAFVLLVGDYDEVTGGIPGATEHGVICSGLTDVYPSDYYYSCITKNASGKYDEFGDLCIGRFSVENDNHLLNMVQKAINHEREFSPKFWRETAGFTNSWPFHTVEPTYTSFVDNLMDNCNWDHTFVDCDYAYTCAIKAATINYFNEGVSFVQYMGLIGYDNTWSTDGLDINYFSCELNNNYKVPFINAVSGPTARFDNVESLGEFLSRYDPTKGSVGYIGSTRPIGYSPYPTFPNPRQRLLPELLFNEGSPIAGELLRKTQVLATTSSLHYLEHKYAFILLGDPALNILADGFEITRNVTADCPAKIPCRVRIHNGATLTVPANCNLKFLEVGKLTVDENGSMVIGDGALVYGVNSQIDTVIHIKGGDFIVGEDVVFQDLPGGILLVDRKAGSLPPNYNLRKITFNNTPLTYRRNTLEISSCIFNQASNIKTSLSRTKIDSCSFNESSFLLEYALNPSTGDDYYAYQTFHNCSFTGNGTNIAMKFHNTQFVDIFNNTIIGYETAISLHDCGLTLVDLRDPRFIGNNNIANCGTGIELYNSVAHFRNNHIHNNTHGVKLFNNSYTVFYWDQSEPNIIQNCDSIELYASANSFPTYFKYNIISDASNQGNPSDIPLFWWDVEPPYPNDQDVKYNCWGNNFDPQYHLYPSLLDWDPVWDCTGKSGSSPRDDDEELYLAGLDYFANEDYTNAESTFKELIQTYPDSHFAIAALHELFALEHFTNNDFYSLNSFYAAITPSDSNLYNTAVFLSTRCLVKERDWQPAVDWYEERITNPPSYQDSVFAVIDLGDIHLMMESDTVNGGKSGHFCYYSLPNIKPKSRMQYEENKTTLLATLPQIKKPKNDKNTPLNENNTPLNDKKGVLGECVPNPTNGDATISYELFTGGVVEIQLFNSVGQMVKSLPQGKLSKGNYKTTISVVGLPVGVYHYTLVVNGERVDGKKVVVN